MMEPSEDVSEERNIPEEDRRAEEQNCFISDKESKPIERMKPHAQAKLLSATEKCKVCHEAAARHVHYGATTCFSCRAFFRRSIQNKTSGNYTCRRSRKCEIDLKTRKNCQFCRFNACLEAGMKPSWVLSEEERRRRFKQKKVTFDNTAEAGEKPLTPTKQIEKRKYANWKRNNKNRCPELGKSEDNTHSDSSIHGLDLSSLQLNHRGGGLRIRRPADLQETQGSPDQMNRAKYDYSHQQQMQFGGHTQQPNPFRQFLQSQLDGYKRLRRTTFPGVEKVHRPIPESRNPFSKYGLVSPNLQEQPEAVGNNHPQVSLPQENCSAQSRWQDSYKQHFQQQFQQLSQQRHFATENTMVQRPGVIVHPHQQMSHCQHNGNSNLFLQQQQQIRENYMRHNQNMRQYFSQVENSGISGNLPQILISQQKKEQNLEMIEETEEQSEVYTDSEDEHWVNDPIQKLEVLFNEPEVKFTEEEDFQLKILVKQHNERYHSVNFGEELMKEILMSAMFGISLSMNAALSGYRLQVERVTRIANNLPEFAGLNGSDQASLLKENADMLVSLRAALFFDRRKKGVDQVLNSMGIEDLETTKLMITKLMKENKMNNINYKAFNSIQTTSNEVTENRNTFLQTKVAEMISDEVSMILITYIILFSSDFCSLNNSIEIEQIQDKFIRILQRYIYSQSCRAVARCTLARNLRTVTCVRELTDIKKNREISKNVNYSET